jgi:dynactin complex subunit
VFTLNRLLTTLGLCSALCCAVGCQSVNSGQLNSLTVENRILKEQNEIQARELTTSRAQLTALNEKLQAAEIELARQQTTGQVRR